MEEIEYGLKVYIEKNGWKYSDTKLTVKTVDGYQGGEQDYILISAVRSNPYIRNVDFFTKMNRVNVALTRAKKGFVVFGNSDTLKQ
jgi:superfamily I DNA and/or RNA helicase